MNYEHSINRNNLAETILVDIDDWSVKHFEEEPRKYLGASQIGKSCSRQLWYQFRWAKRESAEGRMHRLWDRGHREEERFIQYLEGIGCRVESLDPETKKQFRLTALENHFGGGYDCQIYLPERFGYTEKILGEFKTASETNFNKFVKEGVMLFKPEYWAQINVYGYLGGFEYCLFFVVNKNDDKLHCEFLKIDQDIAIRYMDKAAAIISAKEAPLKVAQSPANFICKQCNFKNICHYDEAVAKNCRSCEHSQPAQGGQWICNHHGGMVIPEDFIKIGCDSHHGIRNS